ncbi:MAG TPA: hypothetical protein ENN99_08555 [Chloroflexi bacterium]|nr:hypothetical protein [Chloroflexota bacterium]
MMESVFTSPPAAFAVFLLLAYGLYRVGGKLAAISAHRESDQEQPGKHLPYTGGEDIMPVPVLLSYHTFLRLALMFAILHVAALVVSTMPVGMATHRIALVYLTGIGVSVLVLSEGEL